VELFDQRVLGVDFEHGLDFRGLLTRLLEHAGQLHAHAVVGPTMLQGWPDNLLIVPYLYELSKFMMPFVLENCAIALTRVR
ncbi:MAG: hypothetical protein RLZZ612_752, partial [Pseudomonadota bacterium]